MRPIDRKRGIEECRVIYGNEMGGKEGKREERPTVLEEKALNKGRMDGRKNAAEMQQRRKKEDEEKKGQKRGTKSKKS